MQFLAHGQNGSVAKQQPVLVKTYDYVDENGRLLYQTARFVPKDFKQRRPDGNGGFIWNLEGVRRVSYRLPEIISAETVAVAEGEKDSDTLANLGFAATCNPLGAGKWRDDYSETPRWKNVVIFGDADETGQSHVDDVVRSVTGVASSLKWVKLPPGFHDVSDYAGSLPASTAAASIAKLIDETPEVSSLNSSSSYATMLCRAV